MKRGQAAIEYLTTYGWAIIVLIIMVSALSMFGVINPKQWAPDKCEIGAELHCVDHGFFNDNSKVELKMIVKNNLRDRILINQFNCTFENGVESSTNYSTAISLGNEEEQELICETSNQGVLNAEGKIRAEFSINYKKRDGLFYHEIEGTAFSQVNTQ